MKITASIVISFYTISVFREPKFSGADARAAFDSSENIPFIYLHIISCSAKRATEQRVIRADDAQCEIFSRPLRHYVN